MSCNFDDVVCRYPLPGDVPEFLKTSSWFQTRDLGGGMGQYEITADGEVRRVFERDVVEFYAKLNLNVTAPLKWKRKRIEIYASNISSGRPTPDGGYEWSTFDRAEVCRITYAVNIRDGRVSSIKEINRGQ